MTENDCLGVEGIAVALGGREILADISFSVRAGELCVLLGPNGVGKTTLLRCVDGLVPPSRGCISVSGQDISKFSRRELSQRVAYVPQLHQGVFAYPVEEFVLLGRTPHLSWFGAPGPDDRLVVAKVLEQLGIAPLAGRDYTQLSGGERQLVLLARGLVQGAGIMLLDEPTAHLDFTNLHRVMESVKRLTKDRGVAALIALHDPNLALEYADKIALLHDKRLMTILESGAPDYISRLEESLKKVYGPAIRVVQASSKIVVLKG